MATAKQLRDHVKKLELIGARMSNVFYNWKQTDRFDGREKKMMDELVRRWDAAVRNPPK